MTTTAQLLEGFVPAGLSRRIHFVRVFGVNGGFFRASNVDWCAASINSGPLSFVAEDNARPGHQQPMGPHAGSCTLPRWSTEHLEEDPEVFPH